MADEQDGSWDWDRAFDEDFVRGARAREATGEDRARRAARIAAQHRSSAPWRGDAPLLDTHHRAGRLDRPRREGRRGLLLVVLLLLVGGVLLGTGAVGGSSGTRLGATSAQVDPPTSAAAAPPALAVFPPVPGDAWPTRRLPLPPAPAGPAGYRFSALGGQPGSVRFDPCRPVHWVMRPDNAPRGAAALVTEAFAELSAATGLLFVPDGGSDEDPDERRRALDPDRYGDVFSPVLVAWSDPRESPRLRGDVAAFAGPLLGDDGRGLRLASGQVVLDAPLFRSLRDRDEARGIVLHELGHLVGLDHVRDERDIMHARSEAGSAVTRYTPGALRGLRLLGGGTCFS